MKYKIINLLFLLTLICGVTFSQKLVKIGLTEETIYPFTSQEQNIPANFFITKANISDIKVFGMGEATHGTKEFFNIKKETFKYLVLNYNYKIFGIESSYAGCSYINDYVSSGKGNLDSVILNFDFWTWRTEEIKDLIRWIKDYNLTKTPDEKIIFYGFDMQNFYSPVQYLNSFANIGDIKNSPELIEILKPIIEQTEIEIYKKLKTKNNNYADSLMKLYNLANLWVQNNRAEIETHYSKRKFNSLQYCAENFYQSVKNLNAGSNYRDSCMAENIEKIQQENNERIFIWAHNGHINLANPEASINIKPMGAYLKDNYKDNYYAVGFVFSEGKFQAIKGPNSISDALFKYAFARKKLYKGLMECSVPISKKNSFTHQFEKSKLPTFFIDLADSHNPLFTTLKNTYDIGAVFLNYKRSSGKILAKQQFNGLIFLPVTTKSSAVKLH